MTRRIIHIMPNTGHHYYFMPLAVADQGHDAYKAEKELPNLSGAEVDKLRLLCSEQGAWQPIGGFYWLRGKFGEKLERRGRSDTRFKALGIWIAIETNTGYSTDGYIRNVELRPPPDFPPWVTLRDVPRKQRESHYISKNPNLISFDIDKFSLDLVELFNLRDQVSQQFQVADAPSSAAKCEVELRWKRDNAGMPVDVDLIVDFGNSRTIVFGLERSKMSAAGRLNEICRPILFTHGLADSDTTDYQSPMTSELVPDSWFTLMEAPFEAFFPPKPEAYGFFWDEVERRTGPIWRSRTVIERKLTKVVSLQPHVFMEHSPAIIGPRAREILAARPPEGYLTFLSSPKRYVWDTDFVGFDAECFWHMHRADGEPKTLGGEMLYYLPLKEIRDRLNGQNPREQEDLACHPESHPKWPKFGRADSLIWTALSIIETAARQIQSPAWRAHHPVKRRLSSITVTFPPGWTRDEYQGYRASWEWAANIHAWVSPKRTDSDGARIPPVHVELRLDEALASQLAIVYSEVRHLRNRSEDWIGLYGRVRGGVPSVRVLTIDIGGGTTDTSVVEYTHGGTATAHLTPRVLFTDSSSVAGDKLIKDIIERGLLPKLGEACAGNDDTRGQFKRAFESDTLKQRLALMVITRTVLMPLVVRWLQDFANGRDAPSLGGWSPAEVGADLLQTQALNRIFAEAGLVNPGEALFDYVKKFDINYTKIRQIILAWFKELADVHARYAAALECDLVIVTGKPSELPPVKELLRKTLPVEQDRLIFANDYYAGDWLPASQGGSIRDAKMVTALGAAVYKAIRNNQMLNWKIEDVTSQYPPARHYWGRIPDQNAAPFREDEILMSLEQDSVSKRLSVGTIIGRARFMRIPAEPVYVLTWKRREDKTRGHPVLDVVIKRETLNEYGFRRNEHLLLERVEGRDDKGNAIGPNDVVLKLQTMLDERGHWLDQGRFEVQW